MTVEEIVTERQKLATEVLDGSKQEMANLGLTVDSLQIQSIDDMGAGYIAAMAAPNNAAIQRQAKIAQAQADQAAAEAQQASARKQAEFARQTAVVQAQYKAEIDKAQAEAAQAGPLAQAEAQRAVIAAQAQLAQHQAALRQQQLVSEVIRPAEAEAEKVKILAIADAERTRIAAEAAASNNRVALDQMLIAQLPQIVKEAAGGLAGANVSILNGADGLGEIAAGLVSQGLTILDNVRRGVNAPPTNGENGTPRQGNGQLPA
jgi:regulator of protease activity HflC (stomatin/prohibitin superfamily)